MSRLAPPTRLQEIQRLLSVEPAGFTTRLRLLAEVRDQALFEAAGYESFAAWLDNEWAGDPDFVIAELAPREKPRSRWSRS